MALLPVADAHARLIALFEPLEPEEVPLARAAGRVLARDVVAPRAQPPFAASAMDGYAVHSADAAPGAALSDRRRLGRRSAPPGRCRPGRGGAHLHRRAGARRRRHGGDPGGRRRRGRGVVLRAGRDADCTSAPPEGDFAAGARVEAPRRLAPGRPRAPRRDERRPGDGGAPPGRGAHPDRRRARRARRGSRARTRSSPRTASASRRSSKPPARTCGCSPSPATPPRASPPPSRSPREPT